MQTSTRKLTCLHKHPFETDILVTQEIKLNKKMQTKTTLKEKGSSSKESTIHMKCEIGI